MHTYKKIDNITPVVEYIVERISNNLHAGKQVLWLVSGGSASAVATAVSKQLQGKDLRLLTVSLTDERYGSAGHSDSNWQQLHADGFDVPGASLVPVLETGEDFTLTVEKFNENLRGLLRQADYRLGLFGIGADGHTAGLLPGSPALAADTYAAGYKAPDYQRITMTPVAIGKLDEAVVYAMGAAKWAAIDRLDDDVPVGEQPAQVLKTVPSLTVCSDRKGESV